jgi:CHAT domain-containing protein
VKLAAGLLLASIASVAHADPAPITDEERTVSPYLLVHGPLDNVQRAERRELLATTAEAAGDPVRAARHLAIACYTRSTLALDAKLASPTCVRAKALAKAHDLADVDAYLAACEGNLRAWTLDIAGAVARLQDALAIGAKLDPASPEGAGVRTAHFSLGGILIEAGKWELAAHELALAGDQAARAGDREIAGFVDIWTCRLDTQLGDFGAARAACTAAQAVTSATQDVFMTMNLGWIESELEASLDQHAAALAALQRAWTAAQVRGGEVVRPTLAASIVAELVVLGRLDEADAWQTQLEKAEMPASYAPQTAFQRGKLELARGHVDRAIAAFELATASPMHETAIGACYALAAARHGRGDLAGARTALEHALEQIEHARMGLVGSAQRASYMTMHAKAYRELVGVLWDEQGAAAAPRALEVAEAGRARALLDALAVVEVAGAAAPTRRAGEIQAMLDTDSVLVEYVSTDTRLFAIAVTRERIALIPLPGAGDVRALAARISFFRQLVSEARDDDELAPAATQLYADLLAPVVTALPPGMTTLVVSPDGPLHELPFDALHGPDGYVVDRWKVAIVPSASVLAVRAAPRARSASALVVAAPDVAGLPALPFARDEAAVVQARFGDASTPLVGDAATTAALARLELATFSVIHVASHAEVDEVVPLRSGLVLADGRWRADAIYRLHLDADLVVLAACRTSAGAIARGEGVMSLARAFLYAGARATIATQWDIDDAAGPAFADAMYARLAAGDRLVDAVAAAKRELRRRDARPRDWAGYMLVGAPATTLAVAEAPHDDHHHLAIAITAILAGLVAAWLLGRHPGRAAAIAIVAIVGAVLVLRVPPPASLAPSSVRGAPTRLDGTAGRVGYFDASGRPAPESVAMWVMVEPEVGSPAITRLR